MSISVKQSSDEVTIYLTQNFNFDSVDDFRAAYSDKEASTYVVDFRSTEYMDSSGLGMLLNMRRYLENKSNQIKLINCRKQVKKILLLSRFETKFQIS